MTTLQPTDRVLDRRAPRVWTHVEHYPLRALGKATVAIAEHTIAVPDYRVQMDQGMEGACVGFGESWGLSALRWRRYDPAWLYHECKKIDGDPTGEGTELSFGYDVMRQQGHRRFFRSTERDPALDQGITANRWALTVDEIRTEIANDNPGAFGISWYQDFDNPTRDATGDWWIGRAADWGSVRGGHCICVFRASDRRQAVGLLNSWGTGYPLVWLPYAAVARLMNEAGECGFVTAR